MSERELVELVEAAGLKVVRRPRPMPLVTEEIIVVSHPHKQQQFGCQASPASPRGVHQVHQYRSWVQAGRQLLTL
ncbi:MAG: hypothetical protein U1F45_08895 [Burkholderiales bacterium]